MPYFPRKKRFAVLAVPALLALGLTAPSALAATTCDYSSASTLFSPWGDANLYAAVSGSTFENGASGWSWGGHAGIVGGDSDQLLTRAGSHSVEIPGGGLAKSPWICVNATTPSMRFFVRRLSGTGNLTVKGVLAGDKGQLNATTTTLTAASAWQPSVPVAFSPTFMATIADNNLQAQFLFTADAGTTFRIDDVGLDPFKRT